MKRFIKILNWCKEHPLKDGDVYKINDYVCRTLFFEMGIGFPVSQDEIACCYKLMGYNVEKIFIASYFGGHYWQITT